jgi:uncharacterized membrane protein YebE (DUF533 family)
MAESKLRIPPEGPERDAAFSGMGKEAAAAGVLASLLVIDPDHPGAREYLDDLARQLGLDAALAAEMDMQARVS